jgi:predicted ATPase
MGVVYRGRHAESGELAAVKTVLLPHTGLLSSIRREIHALARLDHPGIVRIVGQGVQDGVPWYAMELLDGRTLRGWRSELGAGAQSGPRPRTAPTDCLGEAGLGAGASEPPEHTRRTVEEFPLWPLGPGSSPRSTAGRLRVVLQPVLTLVRRLCGTLSFLHGEGLVHRDLKPDNVVVKPDGMPVLVDFGLSLRFAGELSREGLEVAGLAAGTVAYMAPEQLRGELVDARADLWALGCIVYELLAGQPPFPQGPVGTQDPPRLSELVEGVPPALEEVVLRLLRRRPRERLGYADSVAAVFARLGGDLAEPAQKARAYLYRPGFAGRNTAMEEFRGRLRRLEQGGAMVLLHGESGVGKTRLAVEVAREARLCKVQVLTGEGHPAPASAYDPERAGGAPLQALAPMLEQIADRCREGGADETERLLGPRGRVLAQVEPVLSALPGQEAYPEPADLPAEAARLRLFSAMAETFEALISGIGAPSPHLLILDDLQWADELTLGFLEHLCRRWYAEGRPNVPVLVLGTYRTEDVRATQASPLKRLLEAPEVVRIPLERLEEPGVGAMVRDMLALASPPGLFVRWLSRHSEGNPFFVAEYLRAAVTEGLLYRDEDGDWQVAEKGKEAATEAAYEALPLPHSLRELVERRLAGLSDSAGAVLQAACVLGREMDEALVAETAGISESGRLEAIEELLALHVLEEPGGGRLRFGHDKLREVAYQRLAEPRRRDLHRRAAEALAARCLGRADGPFADLGQHWEQAGTPEQARPCYLQAARRAKERYALSEAERLYRAYLRLVGEPTAESLEARNALGSEVLRMQGRVPEAIEEHRRELEEAIRLSDRAAEERCLRSLGVIHYHTGHMADARECFSRALAIARERGDRAEEAIVLGNLANLHHHHGHPDEARALYEQALAILRAVRNRRGEGMILGNLAALLDEQGPREEAHALYRQALAASREVGDRVTEGTNLGNFANLHMDQGRLEEARSFYEQALVIQREVGNRRMEGFILGNFAELHFQQGRLEEAWALYQRALAIHREGGNRPVEGFTLCGLANIRARQGRADEARALYERALGIHHGLGNRRFEAITMGGWAELERRVGRLAEAEPLLEQAEAIFRDVGDLRNAAASLCERGHAALATHRPARDLLNEARALARELNVGSESTLEKAVARLERAVQAFEAGRPLIHGECAEDLPERLRRRPAGSTIG